MTFVTKKQFDWCKAQEKLPGIFIPIRVKNPLNGSHGRWWAKSNDRKTHRRAAMIYVRGAGYRDLASTIEVTMTRYSPRTLDQWDGLPAALKPVVDGVADAFGVRDDCPLLKWMPPKQEKSPAGCYGVRVEIGGDGGLAENEQLSFPGGRATEGATRQG